MNNTMIIEIALIAIIGFVVVHFYFDILRLRREKKDLQRTAKIRSEFIAMTVHQLRTPLAKVKWILHAVIEGDTGDITEQQKNVLKDGYHENEKMVHLLNDLLDMSSAENAGLGYKFRRSNIEILVDEVVESFSLAARQKKIDLILKKIGSPIPEIVIDSRKISLALGNLIDNAIHYTPDGGKVEVVLENIGECIKVKVNDNGIGIPENESRKIFTQFFRAKNAKKTQVEGTGLGLYIVKNIIKIHGGAVCFESEENKGTTFTFTIPFRAEGEIRKDVEKFVAGM